LDELIQANWESEKEQYAFAWSAPDVASLMNYGCAGGLDLSAKPKGKPVDEVDYYIMNWRRCIQCAEKHCGYRMNRYGECTNKKNSCGRYSCECDKQLAKDLKGATYSKEYSNGAPGCVAGTGGGNQPSSPKCCKVGQTFFAYNVNHSSCCDGAIRPIGTC